MSEPDANGLVYYLLVGAPDAIASAVGAVRDAKVVGVVGAYEPGDPRRRVCDAVAAERERCAAIAEDEAERQKDAFEDQDGPVHVARFVAERIRGGEP